MHKTLPIAKVAMSDLKLHSSIMNHHENNVRPKRPEADASIDTPIPRQFPLSVRKNAA
jgi:hypothetical protein